MKEREITKRSSVLEIPASVKKNRLVSELMKLKMSKNVQPELLQKVN